MRNLIRFTSTKEYAEQFLSGKIYMNTMSFFWSKGFEDQKDYFEGVSYNIPKNKMESLPQDLRDVLSYDIAIRIDAYKYTNICSFYRLNVDEFRKVIQLPSPAIDKFGDYAIIILDENKFINRILKEVKMYPGWDVISGDVNYLKRVDSTNPNNYVKHTMDLMLQKPVNLDLILENKQSIKIRDCFDKTQGYSYQNEYRICLNRDQKIESAYILNIGDLSDIAYIVKTKDLRRYLMKKYCGFRLGNVLEQRKPYQGTISREQLRNNVLEVDGKVWVMATIG